jgi:BirA family biotin operon repressor/biotin-[acetyl-CoA-carboxylase] ligase
MNQTALEKEQKEQKKADELIDHIRRRPDHFFKWERLAAKLMVDQAQLERIVKIVSDWEYRLKIRKNLGVAFVAPPDLLTNTEIDYKLKTAWLGRTVYSFRSVKSTNDVAVKMIEKGAPEGAIVTADEQTKGRGRFTREWHSPPGAGIYLSIILRPALRPEDAPGIAIMTAVALADTIAHYRPGLVQIKWPNDVWINGRKTAGILTELSAEKNKIHHVVVGVGINVNHQAGDFPEELRKIATSVRRELRRKVDRVELLRLFLYNFEREYHKYLRYRLKQSHAKIRRYSALIGHEITLAFGKNTKTGLVKDIDRNGCMILQTETGIQTITAGEVTVVKE